MTKRTSIHRRIEAFTLIEVVFAVAIVAFALVIIIGLLPVGLKSVRDTEDDQAMGAIVTQVRAQVQALNLTASGLTALTTTNDIFSQEGLPVNSYSGTNTVAYYLVTFALSNSGIGNSNFLLAGSGTPAATNVVVTVKYPAPNYPQQNVFSIMAASQVGN